VTTTLFDLTRALGARGEDDHLVACAVLSILRRGRARFVEGGRNPEVLQPGRTPRKPVPGGC
jgi:hypothetical protein